MVYYATFRKCRNPFIFIQNDIIDLHSSNGLYENYFTEKKKKKKNRRIRQEQKQKNKKDNKVKTVHAVKHSW